MLQRVYAIARQSASLTVCLFVRLVDHTTRSQAVAKIAETRTMDLPPVGKGVSPCAGASIRMPVQGVGNTPDTAAEKCGSGVLTCILNNHKYNFKQGSISGPPGRGVEKLTSRQSDKVIGGVHSL